MGGCALIATCLWLFGVLRRWRNARIIATGTPLRARVTALVPVSNLMILGSMPYRLRVSGRDPISGQRRDFVSGYLWDALGVKVDETVVIVYLRSDQPGRYLVDLSSLHR